MLNHYLGHSGFSVAEHLKDILGPNQGIQIIVNLAQKNNNKQKNTVSGTFGVPPECLYNETKFSTCKTFSSILL